MKRILYYVLILGLLFLHPRNVAASDIKKGIHYNGSFQKLQKENSVIDNSQNSSTSFNDDLFTDDDDDINISAKKILLHSTAFIIFSKYLPHNRDAISENTFLHSPYFFHLSSSYFISLKVFRL